MREVIARLRNSTERLDTIIKAIKHTIEDAEP